MTLAKNDEGLIALAHKPCAGCKLYLGPACAENGWHECAVFDSIVHQWTREGGCPMHEKQAVAECS